MDSYQRSSNYLFWQRIVLCLTVFSLLYIGAVRPLQSLLIEKIVYPAASNFVFDYVDIQITAEVDEIDLITQWPKPDQRTKIELPFSGYVWLALALFWTAKNRKLIRILLFYQFALVILMPLVFVLIMDGHGWMIVAANLHDRLYKVLFIIVGLLAVRNTSISLKKKTSLVNKKRV